jgi:hypothetical protein
LVDHRKANDPEPQDFSLPKQLLIRRKAEYDVVFKRRCSAGDGTLVQPDVEALRPSGRPHGRHRLFGELVELRCLAIGQVGDVTGQQPVQRGFGRFGVRRERAHAVRDRLAVLCLSSTPRGEASWCSRRSTPSWRRTCSISEKLRITAGIIEGHGRSPMRCKTMDRSGIRPYTLDNGCYAACQIRPCVMA